MKIRYAASSDYEWLKARDRHVSDTLLSQKISNQEIYVLEHQGEQAGWIRFGYFWDNTPFLNLLWLDEPYRGQGLGREAMYDWEQKMLIQGYDQVMTSTQADEDAQHFYRKLGYKDAGCLVLDSQPLEIVMLKKL